MLPRDGCLLCPLERKLLSKIGSVGDDLITPVYVPATRPPVYKHHTPQINPRTPIGAGGRPCDDEEDCDIGSGSGEINTDDVGLPDIEKGPPFSHTFFKPSNAGFFFNNKNFSLSIVIYYWFIT